jgi:hypothetical protein
VKDKEIDDILKKAASTSPGVNPRILRTIAGSIESSLSPVRPLPPPWLMTAALLLVCTAVALAGAALNGFLGIKKMNLSMRMLIFPALGILAWLAASTLVRQMVPGSLRRISSGTTLAISSVGLAGVFALMFRDYRTDHFISAGIACLLTGLLYAVPAALLSWLLLRRGFAVSPVSAGCVAGTLAGLAGVGMLELHCPNFEAAHVLVWHTAVVPLSGALGAVAGWALRFRSSSRARTAAP